MAKFNFLTFVILGVCVFCTSEKHIEMVLTIQNHSAAAFIIIILTIYLVLLFSGKKLELPTEKILNTVCLVGVLEIIYATVQLLGILPNNYHYAYFSGSLNNPAIFGMLLSFCLTISIYKSITRDKQDTYIWQALSCVYATFIVLSASRTAILASLCSVIAIVILTNKKNFLTLFKNIKNNYILITCLTIGIFGLYIYKRDSADGRLLIWNVCLEMINEKPIWGWGVDGYVSQYMNYQADYLSKNPSNPFLLLADETKNPFNEFIHIAVIWGIPCALLFTSVIIWLMWHIYNRKNKYRPILFSSILVFFIWCMFSYPLNIPFVWLIIFFIILSSIPIKLNKSKNIAKTIVVLSLGSLCFYLIGRSAVRNIRRIYLQEHATTIFDIKILEKYDTMYKEFSNDGLFLYNYAAMLHYYGDFRKSIAVFKDCSSYINDYNMMILMGDNYQQLNIPDSALKYYKRASEMIPNRFLPLYYQMTVYQEQDEMNKAKQIAEVIIHKENKIRKSKTIEEIIKRANDCLKK